MPIHLTPDIDILGAIKQIDHLLREMDILPVLEYQKICYKLNIDDEPFMTIAISANSITYRKLYQPENEEVHYGAYKRIETFIRSFSTTNAAIPAV